MFRVPRALLLAAPFAALCGGCSPEASPALVTAARIVGEKGRDPGELYSPRAVAADSEGGFYVVDRTGRIQRFDRAGKLTCLWSLPEFAAGQPVGIAVEADGNVLVNDSHYSRILRYSPDGGTILACWGSAGGGPGQLTCGRDVVVDSEGFVYAGDYGGKEDRIQKFDRRGGFILEWGGRGEEPGRFRRPQGMAVERRGGEELILVADAANHRVQRFTRDGEWVSAFGRVGRGPGELMYPYGVAAAEDGTIYVCEWGNHRIQRFDAEGRSLGAIGEAGHGEGCLAHPWEVALTPDGQLLVADCENHRVQVFRWPTDAKAARAAFSGAEAVGGWGPAPRRGRRDG